MTALDQARELLPTLTAQERAQVAALRRAGVSLGAISAAIGHADSGVTARHYVDGDAEQAAGVVDMATARRRLKG